MECKKALTEAGGDEAKAIQILKDMFKKVQDKRADNVTAEGRVFLAVKPDGSEAAMVEIQCESAPVATGEVMKQFGIEDPAQVRAKGVIDLPTIQRYLNFHFSVTIDLFGADQSSNAALFYSAGLKGRYEETKRNDDHLLKGDSYKILEVANGQLVEREVPMLNSLNEVLRDDYIRDSVAGIGRWNRVIEKAGLAFRLAAPHKAFNRHIGTFSGIKVSPDGQLLSETEWAANVNNWLPSEEDRAYVASLMGRVIEPGKMANWIAAPSIGINRQPVDFDYVRFN